MNKQDKQLLLKALCGYIPYRVQALVENVFSEPEDVEIEAVTSHQEAKLDGYNFTVDIQNLKPYLRSMESMTEKEKKERKFFITEFEYDDYWHPGKYADYVGVGELDDYIDWLNEHHFDYHGLIEKDLALPAPDGMY